MNHKNILDMKTTKKLYVPPVIGKIELDSEISLQLQSAEDQDPDGDPVFLKAPDYFNNDPYKTNLT